MSWLVADPVDQAQLAAWLRRRLTEKPALVMPGAHDALSALVARDVGFDALYLSGAAYSASRGLPDAGIVTSSEVASRVRDIVRATGLPLLVDIDTGYGSPLAAARAARELVEAGVAAVQVEDQTLPKACGHLEIQRLATVDEAVGVLRAIREAAPTVCVVARTDARSVEGLEGVIARSRALRAAGADMIFPEALRSAEEFRAVRAAVDGPLLANMTEFGKSPPLTVAELDALGYAVALFPVSSLRVAARAVQRLYKGLRDHGTTAPMVNEMLTRNELYALLRYPEYATLDSIVQDVLASQTPSLVSANGAGHTNGRAPETEVVRDGDGD